MRNERHVETLVPIDGRRSTKRVRNIGTFRERAILNTAAADVLEQMQTSGHFDDVDLDGLSNTVIGFLREGSSCLLGRCSFARTKGQRPSKQPGQRTWRILVNRQLIRQQNGVLEAILYHEFLHAVLGSDEQHGSMFQSFEALWPFSSGD